MIYIYPANRMEDLLTLFDKVQQTSNLPTLAQEFVLVQNPGMQHWLNMEQANISGIAMNAAFVLPAQFLWKQLKALSGETDTDQAPYSREVLAWRIDSILQSGDVLNNEVCAQANAYWQKDGQVDCLKRFQLAVQLADLYEQYLIYRPSWVNAWAAGKQSDDLSKSSIKDAKWQGHIWYLLQQESAYNPIHLLDLAKQNLEQNKHLLPKRISIFGINALAPMWVDFLALLGEVTDVHFYHLNPCYEYWADIQTDKSKAKQAYLAQIDKWPVDAVNNTSANPLLSNLGQQGREFLSLLHQTPNIEIPIFDELFSDHSDDIEPSHEPSSPSKLESELEPGPSVLLQLQKDILTLTDKRDSPIESIDDSITITSAHSALREVQGLHDYLLHLFNDRAELTPKDILVMCPQIEQYAPYIDSVFVRGWEDIGENIPPLPCSIADRISKDSEPLVGAFSELLSLPDSRFQVNQILSYLRLLPLQLRFGLTEQDIELISDWLIKANVHWGLNKQHKNAVLGIENASGQYSWQQGLKRLLLGFAYGDETVLYQDDLLLPWVEGSNAIILGKLMQLCEQLMFMAKELNTAKTATAWQQQLTEFLERLFVEQEFDNGYTIITDAISSLVEYCEQAEYTGNIELAVIREYLNHHFSQPDPGRQFMIGQITFCSMLPMRSIPFKVIAVLGLNDGEYPRQRQPLGFDLMSMTPAQQGDRSIRGDDRYLFLEALISARENIYLSYQGNDIKNNNERQPSIVLRELMDYLQFGYGWQFKAEQQLRQLPLQVFSLDNFSGKNRYQSFDHKWLDLAQADTPTNSNGHGIALPELEEPIFEIDIKQLQAFLTHPSKVFAELRLKLFLNNSNQAIDDAEPFELNFLDKYLYQQALLAANNSTISNTTAVENRNVSAQISAIALRSGDFPDNPLVKEHLQGWQMTMHNFIASIENKLSAMIDGYQTGALNETTPSQHQVVCTIQGTDVTVKGDLQQYQTNEHIYQWRYRPASAKAKDMTALYLDHLLACAQYSNSVETKNIISLGFFVNEKKQQLQTIKFEHCDDAQLQLNAIAELYFIGLSQPLLLNSVIAEAHYWQKEAFVNNDIKQNVFAPLWQGNQQMPGLGSDPYLQYFWPLIPNITEHESYFSQCYKPIFEQLIMTSEPMLDTAQIDCVQHATEQGL